MPRLQLNCALQCEQRTAAVTCIYLWTLPAKDELASMERRAAHSKAFVLQQIIGLTSLRSRGLQKLDHALVVGVARHHHLVALLSQNAGALPRRAGSLPVGSAAPAESHGPELAARPACAVTHRPRALTLPGTPEQLNRNTGG